MHRINNIPNPTFRKKLERFIVKSIMKRKILIGQGLERQAKNIANKNILEIENEDNKPNDIKPIELEDEDHLATELHN